MSIRHFNFTINIHRSDCSDKASLDEFNILDLCTKPRSNCKKSQLTTGSHQYSCKTKKKAFSKDGINKDTDSKFRKIRHKALDNTNTGETYTSCILDIVGSLITF
ncbi:hypothetical protein Ancab_020690 [Ancistrocladus abbreviatus]